MKTLKEYIIEGVGHSKMRLGAGSSGTAYDLGNGFVRKTLRVVVPGKSAREKEWKIIDKWAKTKDLKVISPIKDWDYEGYTLEKLQTPCDEGRLIDKVLWRCLFSPERKNWDEKKIQKAYDLVGKEDAEFVMNWLDDFCDDYVKITKSKNISDDIRSANIGKDKNGDIKCFDWFDPYSIKESLLDDEDKLISNTKDDIKNETIKRNIEKLAHEMYIKFGFDPYTGTLEEIEGETREDAIEILRDLAAWGYNLSDFDIEDLISLIKSSQWKKYKKELQRSNLKYKEALIEDANRIEEYIRKNK